MRTLFPLLFLLLVFGCPRSATDGRRPASEQLPPAPRRVAVVFSTTESDPWTAAVLGGLGTAFGIDPLARVEVEGHLDLCGPYAVELQGEALQLNVALTGLAATVGLEAQASVGGEALDWLERLEPDLVWLDGDLAQYNVGRLLRDDLPLLFTGVVLERDLYYGEGRLCTGVYRRHSLVRVLSELWRAAPELAEEGTEPRRYVLATDDSPLSVSRAKRFSILAGVLPEGDQWLVLPPAEDWGQLKALLSGVTDQADALIFCGVGEEGASPAFTEEGCPPDLLAGLDAPAVALGPSRVDMSGVLSLSIRPAAHVDAALTRLKRILLEGADPRSVGLCVPEEMDAFRSEGGGDQNSSTRATALARP